MPKPRKNHALRKAIPGVVTRERGAALIVCLLMMLAALMLGTSAAQIAIQQEKASRNERDRFIALQGAEAALRDAELDIENSTRVGLFVQQRPDPAAGQCEQGAGNPLLGLCHPAEPNAFPVWRRIDVVHGASATSVPYGYFTGRSLVIGGSGTPVSSPRYLIEVLPASDKHRQEAAAGRMFRITAIGYGTKESAQAVLQSYYRQVVPNAGGPRTGRLAWREILNWEELRGALEHD